jgi:hypothetical protein
VPPWASVAIPPSLRERKRMASPEEQGRQLSPLPFFLSSKRERKKGREAFLQGPSSPPPPPLSLSWEKKNGISLGEGPAVAKVKLRSRRQTGLLLSPFFFLLFFLAEVLERVAKQQVESHHSHLFFFLYFIYMYNI